MAASAAAVGPCFSTKNVTSSDSLLRIGGGARTSSAFRVPFAMVRSMDHLSISLTPQRNKRASRISASVAQDEAAASSVEESAVKEEGEEEEEEEVETPVNTKLYFGNLPYNCDSAQLAGIIQEHASPEIIEVLYDRSTGRSRGFAFVTMASTEDCELVIKNLDGSQYGGRIMRVNFSDKPKAKDPLYPESEFKLFVGNLSWSVTSEMLTDVFQEYGNIVGARVLYDGETGGSRGYGFVSYSSKAEMDAAIETLDGMEVEGRAMRVSLALGKKN